MLNSGEPSDSGHTGLATESGPGWWSWPLIGLSVVFIGWSVNLFPLNSENSGDQDTGAFSTREDLALLKIQSQAIIATAALDPNSTGEAIEQMKDQVVGLNSLVAITLVEQFTNPSSNSGRRTLRKARPKEEVPDWYELVERGIADGVSMEEREQLRSNFGWFADLLPEAGGKETPYAGAIRAKATAILMLLVVVFLAAGAGIIGGGVFLLILLRKQKATGTVMKLDSRFAPQGVMLESFALYLGVMAGGELAGLLIYPGLAMISYGLAVVVPFVWPILRGYRWKQFARSLGWHRGEGWWKEIGCGFLGYTGVLAIASVGIFLTGILSLLAGFLAGDPGAAGELGKTTSGVEPQTHPIVGWIYEGGWTDKLLCLLLAAGFAPVFEEAFFRGALHRYLRGKMGFLFSALLTGVVFAALHPQGWIAIPALGAIGVGFSLLREWRDSLVAPMVAHAINNGALVALLCFVL